MAFPHRGRLSAVAVCPPLHQVNGDGPAPVVGEYDHSGVRVVDVVEYVYVGLDARVLAIEIQNENVERVSLQRTVNRSAWVSTIDSKSRPKAGARSGLVDVL